MAKVYDVYGNFILRDHSFNLLFTCINYKINSMKGKFYSKKGLITKRTKVTINSDWKGGIPGELKVGEVYTISEVMLYNGGMVSIEEIKPGIHYDVKMFEPVPFEYNVFNWKGHYILAKDVEQAQRIWDTWIDLEKMEAAERGDFKRFKKITIREGKGDSELFPKQLRRLKCEAPYPCIVSELDWDEPLYEYTYTEDEEE